MDKPVHSYCSTLDSIWPPIIQYWILAFPCDLAQLDHIATNLRDGLIATIHQLPFLSGRVVRENEDTIYRNRLKLVYSLNGTIELATNNLTQDSSGWCLSYESLAEQGMPLAALCPDLLFPNLPNEELSKRPITMQANFIEGGCLLGICLHHSLFDGLGASTIVGIWAQKCNEAAAGKLLPPSVEVTNKLPTPPHSSVPVSLEQSGSEDEIEVITHAALPWQLLGVRPPSKQHIQSEPSTAPQPYLESLIFAASTATLRALRDRTQAGSDTLPSTFDTTAALLWRSIMRARAPDLAPSTHTVSRLRIPVNVRLALQIPSTYLGNVLMNSITTAPFASLLASRSVAPLAAAISQSKQHARAHESVTAAIKLSHHLADPATRRPLFATTTGTDLVLTSWHDLPFYKHDWGRTFGEANGRVGFVRTHSGQLGGVCAILPARMDGKVMEVLISAKRHQLERLRADNEFNGYFSVQGDN